MRLLLLFFVIFLFSCSNDDQELKPIQSTAVQVLPEVSARVTLDTPYLFETLLIYSDNKLIYESHYLKHKDYAFQFELAPTKIADLTLITHGLEIAGNRTSASFACKLQLPYSDGISIHDLTCDAVTSLAFSLSKLSEFNYYSFPQLFTRPENQLGSSILATFYDLMLRTHQDLLPHYPGASIDMFQDFLVQLKRDVASKHSITISDLLTSFRTVVDFEHDMGLPFIETEQTPKRYRYYPQTSPKSPKDLNPFYTHQKSVTPAILFGQISSIEIDGTTFKFQPGLMADAYEVYINGQFHDFIKEPIIESPDPINKVKINTLLNNSVINQLSWPSSQ